MSDDDSFVPIFDGVSLAGWHTAPRIYGSVYPGGPSVLEHFASQGLQRPVEPEKHPARWKVEDGVLIGEQDAPGSGYGGYLVSDQAFGDFELKLEMRPDWPADTGVMLRRQRDSWEGFQVLLDHRPSGGIGGFFGNGLASFSAVPFAIDVARDDADAVHKVLGDRGHIALEVHDNDAMFGEARWSIGAQCRWRNIRIKELPTSSGASQ